jgi:hypothetical protein
MPYSLLHHVFQQCAGYWRAPVSTARCIPAPDYDITSLIIDEDGNSLIDGTYDRNDPTSTVPIEVLWRLACIW